MAELARQTGLSTGLFIREFRRVFGETPHQRRIRARLELAKQLLARGDAVTDVCFEVGCSSLGSFCTLFHSRVGLTPSAYRRSVRTLVQVPGEIRPVLQPGCFELMAQAWCVQASRAAGEIFEK